MSNNTDNTISPLRFLGLTALAVLAIAALVGADIALWLHIDHASAFDMTLALAAYVAGTVYLWYNHAYRRLPDDGVPFNVRRHFDDIS